MKKNNYNTWTLLALLVGGIAGYVEWPMIHGLAEGISKLFINMMKLISLPMIFLAIVSTLTRMTSLSEAGSLLKRILKYTIATTLIAATIGAVLFLIFQPAHGGKGGEAVSMQGSYLGFVLKIIPENPVAPFLENNVLGMAFFGNYL